MRFGFAGLLATGACLLICCNVLISKQITLFSLSVTASDAYAVSLFFINNIITTYYGKQKGQRAIQINMFCLVVFTILTKIHTLFTPSPLDSLSPMYEAIFSQGIRVTVSSIICFYLSQRLDLFLFTYFMHRFGKTKAMFTSLCISQAFDTICFTYLAFWGLGFAFKDIILFSYLIKLICITCMTPLAHFCHPIIKKERYEV